MYVHVYVYMCMYNVYGYSVHNRTGPDFIAPQEHPRPATEKRPCREVLFMAAVLSIAQWDTSGSDG